VESGILKADVWNALFIFFIPVSDQCAQQDPPIGNQDKLMKLACNKYEYGKLFVQIVRILIF